MKTTLRTCLSTATATLLALFLGAAQAAAPVQLVDRIVAVVNNEVITQFELNDRVKLVMKQLSKQGTTLPPQEVLEKQLLERMITDRVQLQLARETGIRVDDLQLDKTLQRIAQENNMTLETYPRHPGEGRRQLQDSPVELHRVGGEVFAVRLRD